MKVRKHTLATVVATVAIYNIAIASDRHGTSTLPPAELLVEPKRNVSGFGRLFPLNTPIPTLEGGIQEKLIEHPSSRIDLLRLGREMVENNGQTETGQMPVGYVFLGQFIDHDITLDIQSSLNSPVSEEILENTRTPDLDLDCVYGDGPEASPFLYEKESAYLKTGAATVVNSTDGDSTRIRRDLLRVPFEKTALIGDPRNDENFVISQLQAAFVAYHNRMVDRLLFAVRNKLEPSTSAIAGDVIAYLNDTRDAGQESAISSLINMFASGNTTEYSKTAKGIASIEAIQATVLNNASQIEFSSAANQEAFKENLIKNSLDDSLKQYESENRLDLIEEARALTIHHYHRVIEEDFLPRLITADRTKDIREKGRQFYYPNGFGTNDDWPVQPFIPIEFSVAAYRFGHSQVPGRMTLRDGDNSNTISATIFGDLTAETGDIIPIGFQPVRSARTTASGDSNTGANEAIPTSTVIDWSYFVPIDLSIDYSKALKLDVKLSSPLSALDKSGIVGAGAEPNLASRNLSRGRSYRLPSGQDLAKLVIDQLIDQRSLSAYGITDDEYSTKAETREKLIISDTVDAIKKTLTVTESPLWFYILEEAEKFGMGEENEKLYKGSIPKNISKGESNGGSTLGPLGGTLVGEVFLGLIDHYRTVHGEGIDKNVGVAPYALRNEEDGTIEYEESFPANMQLTETSTEGGRRRYLLSNFLMDAGVADRVQPENVCTAAAHLPSSECGKFLDEILEI